MNPTTVLVFISAAFGASLPIIAGAAVLRNLSTSLLIVWGLLVFAFVFDIAIMLPYFWGYKYTWVTHFYTPVEASLLGAVFAYWIENESHRRIWLGVVALFLIIWVSLELAGFEQIESYSSSLESLILIVASGYVVSHLSADDRYPLTAQPRFWICCGVLLYFAGNIIHFALSNTLYIWQLHTVLNFIANCLYARGFLCLHPRISGGLQLPVP
jgi:hypothetical protein